MDVNRNKNDPFWGFLTAVDTLRNRNVTLFHNKPVPSPMASPWSNPVL